MFASQRIAGMPASTAVRKNRPGIIKQNRSRHWNRAGKGASTTFLPSSQSVLTKQRNDHTSRWMWATNVILGLANILTFILFWGTQSLSDKQCWARTSSFCKSTPAFP